MMELERRKLTAIRAAHAAGEVIRRHLGQPLEIAYKGETNLVTNVDREAEAVILKLIHEVFPGEAILAEESMASPLSDTGWVIDPLDGTTNFSRDYPLFGVSIAWLGANNRVDVGVVYAPVFDELYWAVRGEGAWCNDRRLSTSRTAALSSALLSSGTPYNIAERPLCVLEPWGALVTQTLALRQDGSAALDLCYVAAGRTDAHFEVGLSPWDVAAGILLVQEAGGQVTTYDGSPIFLNSPSILASNSALHKTLIAPLRTFRYKRGCAMVQETLFIGKNNNQTGALLVRG